MDTAVARGPNQKYCRDCGKLIMERAEICPGCGCRQSETPPFPNQSARAFILPSLDTVTGPMIMLLCLNFLWNGLGNIAVGDKRGWGYGFLNCVFFGVGFFTAFIPVLFFYAYCGYQGYQFLRASTIQANTLSNRGTSSSDAEPSSNPGSGYCNQCGSKLSDGVQFCGRCGVQV